MPSLRWFSLIVLIVILATGGYLFFRNRNVTTYQFVTVSQGPISETVSVTGNMTPMQNVSLAFQNEGTIARTYFNLGDEVHKGDVIARLDTSNLSAALAQAQADVDTQEAQLQEILAGAQPEDVTVSQTSLTSAQSNLEQVKEEQAVLVANANRTLLNSEVIAQPLLTSNISPPVISGMYNKTDTGVMTISIHGTPGDGYFSVTGLGGVSTGLLKTTQMTSSNAMSPVPIGDTGLYLRLPNTTETTTTVTSSSGLEVSTSGLSSSTQTSAQNEDKVSDYNDTTWTIAIPNTTSASYLQNYNTYQQALQTQAQAVAAAQTEVDQAQAGLGLKQAAPISQSVDAQQARVSQAKAAVANAEANLANTEIIAPIDGTLTQQDAKVGEQASPGVKLISIIGSGGFEVDAGVSEKDIGKLQIGNAVAMTFDAFPNEVFPGSIFYIAPTETDTQGVITYLIKVSFKTPDPRFKSGLTADLSINTKHKDSALILPEGTILQNDDGAFVEILDSSDNVKRVPITLGIQDQDGNDEILSGVTADEQVLNIGLKTK